MRTFLVIAVLALCAQFTSANAQIFKKPVAATATAGKSTPLQGFLQFVAEKRNQLIADTKNADTLAGAPDPLIPGGVKDPLAHQCYPAQVRWLETLPDLSALDAAKDGSGIDIGLGVVTKYEILRLARIYAQNGFPPDLKMNCAAMMQDDIQFGLKFAGLFGITLATGGAGGLLGLIGYNETPLGRAAVQYAALHKKSHKKQRVTTRFQVVASSVPVRQ